MPLGLLFARRRQTTFSETESVRELLFLRGRRACIDAKFRRRELKMVCDARFSSAR